MRDLPKLGGGGATLAVLALAQTLANYENKPLALALFAGVAGFWGTLLWKWWKERPTELKVEDFTTHSALNLKITNTSIKPGLGGVELSFQSLEKWDMARAEYRTVDAFIARTLQSDAVDLPHGVARTFQILRFVHGAPEICGQLDGREQCHALQGHGIWRANLHLRWGGGSKNIPRYFKLDLRSKPEFCDATGKSLTA